MKQCCYYFREKMNNDKMQNKELSVMIMSNGYYNRISKFILMDKREYLDCAIKEGIYLTFFVISPYSLSLSYFFLYQEKIILLYSNLAISLFLTVRLSDSPGGIHGNKKLMYWLCTTVTSL